MKKITRIKRPKTEEQLAACKRLEDKYGPDPKLQGIRFYRDAIENKGVLHDHESKDAGNMLYYIAIESCSKQVVDNGYKHSAMWESDELLREIRSDEN